MPGLNRFLSFEFLPFWLIYLPMYFYGLWLAIRSGSANYFMAATPVVKYGRALAYSKFDLLCKLNLNTVLRR